MLLRRDVSLRTNLIILLVLFSCGGFFILIQMPSGGPGGVAAATMRGGKMFVIRPPQGAQLTIPEQITIFENNDRLSDMSRVVFYELNDSIGTENTKSVQLTHKQWGEIAKLRDNWCTSIPVNRLREQSSLLYDIGMRCHGPFGISSRQIKLRGDELPVELRRSIIPPE